jgi:hypothetical protein
MWSGASRGNVRLVLLFRHSELMLGTLRCSLVGCSMVRLGKVIFNDIK